jgi:hypothetical protein
MSFFMKNILKGYESIYTQKLYRNIYTNFLKTKDM